MNRLERYDAMSHNLERKHFDTAREAIAYFTKLGYKQCEFDTFTNKEGDVTVVMASSHNPRDYVEVVSTKFNGVFAVRYGVEHE